MQRAIDTGCISLLHSPPMPMKQPTGMRAREMAPIVSPRKFDPTLEDACRSLSVPCETTTSMPSPQPTLLKAVT